ncbi:MULTISPECIES: hypothetical protein [Variovorax]|jgi:hypothetical protein|uniref:hypothetical protein n=1 Tax=Variovorax TaxID=34072 RepID=UPI00086BB0E2|nr:MULTISPECIES: hypothetical protein [Variovorax]MBN8752067.1 hypothetical protein [Variovorax sp.]ODV17147.1 MAG: hypothetical protein ABT25_30185 [Variovorax sp. SCN 67-20]OJZ09117.1 MAG: hypothetical protein BGP22_34940 [Variovorax sp. 67-131]UKI11591.1 hypothetical protein L3V85_17660 [Variovorax paradoxus]
MRRLGLPSGLCLDRVLCVLLALLSAAALIHGLCDARPAFAGAGVFGLAGALQAAMVLLDDDALRRSRAVREALRRAWR